MASIYDLILSKAATAGNRDAQRLIRAGAHDHLRVTPEEKEPKPDPEDDEMTLKPIGEDLKKLLGP